MASNVRISDGSFDFSGGIDSAVRTRVQSEANPNGLPRNFLSFINNGTVRGGSITPRTGFLKLCGVHDSSRIYQGGWLYEQNFGNPYLMLLIGGRVIQVRVDTDNSVHDVSAGLQNPPLVPQAFMTQGNQFLVIQAGDIFGNPNPTLPLFWDGATLRRSLGIISPNNVPGGVMPFNELPAAGPMVYYQSRIWYAQGRRYTAGDIVDGPSGTLAYQEDDSILKVTENPLAFGGDGFRVPNNAGNITALFYTANLDTTLGQGLLYCGTRKQIYGLDVPISRTAWIAATGANQPRQTIQQITNGPVNDRCIAKANGDAFYQSLEPGIRSLQISTRFFQQWGNVQLSTPEERVLAFSNRALMSFATGIEFDNRLLQAVLPVQTPVGVAFQAIVPLDFFNLSDFRRRAMGLQPAWEGMYEGIDVLQLFEGDFGGLQRAFAVVHSRVDDSIEVWELTDFSQRDTDDHRITMQFETPAWTWAIEKREFDLKKLDGGEIWIDSIAGTVELTVEYRVDADPCWQPWLRTQLCAARNVCEATAVASPACYPAVTFCEGSKFPITLPEPQQGKCDSAQNRPTTRGYQFQVRVTVKGWMSVVGMLIHAIPVEKGPFEGLSC